MASVEGHTLTKLVDFSIGAVKDYGIPDARHRQVQRSREANRSLGRDGSGGLNRPVRSTRSIRGNRADGESRPGQRTAPATVINSASQQSNSKQLAKIGPTTALLSQLALAFLDVATHGARIRQGYRRSRG